MSIAIDKTFTLATVIDHLRNREPFVFSRWGDGEWSAILGHGHHNCDGQEYTPALRRELAEVLESQPDYQLGIQALALRRFGSEIEGWLTERELVFDWADAGIFHGASIRDELGPLIEALNGHRSTYPNGDWMPKLILVGPKRLECTPFSVRQRVTIPERNAYDALAITHGLTVQALEDCGTDCIVAVSGGMGGKILIHLLAEQFPRATILDFGSLWEPYAGVASRRYHHGIIARLGPKWWQRPGITKGMGWC